MPKGGWQGGSKLVVKSGTSMAAPWVSGTVALMMAAAGRPLSIHEIRAALIGTADPHSGPSGRSSTRLGYGYLNVAGAVDAARALGRVATNVRPLPEPARAEEEPSPTGYPPVWVEDASEANLDELQMERHAEGEAVEGDEAVEADQDVEADQGVEADQDVEADQGVEADEAIEVAEADEAIEEFEDIAADAIPADAFDGAIDVPFAWEDVQDALETLDEDVLTGAD